MKKIYSLVILLITASVTMAQPGEGISGEGKTKDGHKVGKWIYTCDATGKEVGEEKYDGDGLLDGYATWYDCDGNLLKEYNYEHGKKIGTQKEFYPFDRKIKREWSMMERPKRCQKIEAHKGLTDIEWYTSYYKNGKPMVEWKGDPCGQRKIIKYNETGGTLWVVEYDVDGRWKHGPRTEEKMINNDSLR